MRRVVLFLAASALGAGPALAQHTGHAMPMPPEPAAEEPASKDDEPALEPEASVSDPHAGHDMGSMEPDPHAGHDMGTTAPDPHAGHDMTMPSEVPVGPPPPEALSGPAHAADGVWGKEAMARGRATLTSEHGGATVSKLMIERAEARIADGQDSYLIDAHGWIGGDIDKFWLKGEVGGALGRKVENVEVQALWSHAIGPFFDLQSGVRYDPQPGPDRAHLVLGVQGLAPYWFELDGALFLSSKGEVTARIEGEYDLRITQRLILQPRAELLLSAQRMRELELGSGLTDASLGLRLRYEFSPQFAPYVGVQYGRTFGATRRYRRLAGEEDGGLAAVAGVRLWF